MGTFAQEKLVTGTVTDSYGLPLPSVNVAVKATNSGTQTDFDGLNSLQAAQGRILFFSFVSTKTIELTIGNETSYNIILEESNAALDEIVV